MLSVSDQRGFPPCPSPFNMAAYVLRHAVTCADKPALIVASEQTHHTLSYAALEAAIRGTGTGLLQAGISPGDMVLMRLGNTEDFPIAYLGAIAAGVVPIPTSAQLTERETASILNSLPIKAVLRAPDVSCASHAHEISLNELKAMRGLAPCRYDTGDANRLAYVVYTSGTSGSARAVGHAHRAIWARQMMVSDWYNMTRTDRLLHAGAFNWTFTLGTGLMDPWSNGATALIPMAETALQALPELLRNHQATLFAAAPGVYRKILKHNETIHIPTLRHGLCAGEKLSSHLQKRWAEATGTALHEAYGMSECSTFLSASPKAPARDGALGRAQNGRRIALLDENSRPVPRGQEGTIAIHRSDPGLMLGYLDQRAAPELELTHDWFLTGDRARMEDDDQIFYLGRRDDMMNAGGFRVSPIEVETALSAHPDISQVGVASVEIKKDTHIIVAFYTGVRELCPQDLTAFAKPLLAGYKQPRAYQYLPQLPTGGNGKLLRQALPPLFKGSNR